MQYLQIVLNLPLNQSFTYSYISPEKENHELLPEIGKRAEIMFGNKKTTEWKKRALKINNNCKINIIDKCVKISDVKSFGNFDYIIDTCDDTNLKVELIIYANENIFHKVAKKSLFTP